MNTDFIYNDGGRKEAGYTGTTGDCVCRAICIASGLPYQEVYDTLANGNAMQRRSKHSTKSHGQRTASKGINVNRQWFQNYMESIGFVWTPTMLIGQGCKVHLKSDELPKGRLVVAVSKHYTAVIDGIINDLYNPDRSGTRCVYGYYLFTGTPKKETTVIEQPKIIEVSKSSEKLNKLLSAKKKWMTKLKRSQNAIKKLDKKINYYNKKK